MVKEFIDYYAKNIDKNSKPINGVIEFFKMGKKKKISMAVCTNKQEHLSIDLLKKIKIMNILIMLLVVIHLILINQIQDI